MNNKQVIVLWVVVGLIAVMGLVPPWFEAINTDIPVLDRYVHKRVCTGYFPVFMPPKKDLKQFQITAPEPVYSAVMKKLNDNYYVSVDVPRLGVQWATVLLVGLGLFFLLADRKRRELAPRERMTYLERMKRAGAGGAAPAPDMAFDDEDLTEDDAPTASDPKHVFSDDEL